MTSIYMTSIIFGELKNHITSFVSITLLLISIKLNAQSYIGLNTANYSGVLGATIHPASVADYPGKFDLVILGLDVHAENNSAMVTRDRAFMNFNFDDFEVAEIHNDKDKYGLLNFELTIPSFMFKTKKWGTIGLINRVRNYVLVDGINSELIEEIYDGFENPNPTDQIYLNQHFDINVMSWDEIGILWAKQIKENKYGKFAIGITPKIIIGNASGFGNFQTDTLGITNDDLINLANFDISYGYSGNIDDIEDNGFSWDSFNKYYFGLDIGFEYTRLYRSDYRPGFSKYLKLYKIDDLNSQEYKYKLSASILDIGRIKYDHGKNNARSLPDLDTNTDINSIEGSFDEIKVLRDSLENLDISEYLTGTYTVGLPTTLQLGIDYHLKGGAYVNGNLGFNLSGLKWADEKTNTFTNLTITPRWENNWVGVHAPFYANARGYTSLGLGFRVGPIALGLRDILPFISRNDVTGTGVYIVFKTFIRKKKEKSNVECARGGKWKKGKKRKK